MTRLDMSVSDSDTDPQEQSEDSNSSNANRLIDLFKQRLKLRAAATVEFRHAKFQYRLWFETSMTRQQNGRSCQQWSRVYQPPAR